MNHSSEDDSDVSESEIEEYGDTYYEDFKNDKHKVKFSDEVFRCPYCQGRKKKDFRYKDILQHANGVAKGSATRSAKQKAKHRALAMYLERDLLPNVVPQPSVFTSEPPIKGNNDEQFVFPWMGIVVNLPTKWKEGKYVGESGSKFRDQLRKEGFNPVKVEPLWNNRGHSGSAIVIFTKDLPGFYNAISFEKSFENDGLGKRDWNSKKTPESSIYGWVAREDDYKSGGIIGKYLKDNGDLKTTADVVAEEKRITNQLVKSLTERNDELRHTYEEEIRKMQQSAREHLHSQRICHEHEKLKLESQMKKLELRGKELEKREAHNENEMNKLIEEKRKNAMKNSSLQMASRRQTKDDENVMRLAEEQKKDKEELYKRIINLEKQLDTKPAVELENERLKGNLNILKHVGDESGYEDMELKRKIDEMSKNSEEKEGELEGLDELNQTLIVKERKSNGGMQKARKELINGMTEIDPRALIGVKRVGELDTKPFQVACKRKYDNDPDAKALELSSLWEEHLRNPEWHPFKIIKVGNNHQEIIDEDDEKLKRLRNELSKELYQAVATALMESIPSCSNCTRGE